MCNTTKPGFTDYDVHHVDSDSRNIHYVGSGMLFV